MTALPAVAAAGVGVLVVIIAGRLGWLTRTGQVAAALVGAAVLAGTGAFGLGLLITFFLTSSALSRYRITAKLGADKPGGRSAAQVFSNGGAAAAFSLLALARWVPEAHYALAGAIAAATADTWATEIGSSGSWPTWSVIGEGRVAPGRSGGVSIPGTAAAGLGAALIGLLAGQLYGEPSGTGGTHPDWVKLMLAAGMAGMLVDSVLGATLEDRCRLLDNDQVNAACTLVGAAVALLLVPLAS